MDFEDAGSQNDPFWTQEQTLTLCCFILAQRLVSTFAEAAGAATKLLLESDNKAKQAAVGVTVPDNVTPVKFHCELGDVVLLEV